MKKSNKINKQSYLNIPISDELMEKINNASLKNNLSKAAYVRVAIENQLKKENLNA